MSLERWAEMARDWKDALCAESPMADFGEVRVIVEVDGGYTVVMAPMDPETGVGGLRAHLAGVLSRMDRGGHTHRTGRAAVVVDDAEHGVLLTYYADGFGVSLDRSPYRFEDGGLGWWPSRQVLAPGGEFADLARFAADPWGAS